MPESLRVGVSPQQTTTALVYHAAAKNPPGVTLILGHGAGASQTSSFMTSFASGLADRGIDAITFNFLYSEQGRRLPDPNDRLEACWYPLHPPGKPDRFRSAHLPDVKAPMLFVQGSRDAFGTPDELRPIIAPLEPPADLYIVEGGDHSFKVRKGAAVSQDDVHRAIQDHIAAWLRKIAVVRRAR